MTRSEWEGDTGDAWAAHWRRTDRSFGALTDHLLSRTRGVGSGRVLDIGCGAGELSLAIARSNPRANVLGVDISLPLIEVARDRGANLHNVHFAQSDASEWLPADNCEPDLLVSRHGVMFFTDPPTAFAHLARITADGAQLLFSCFRSLIENPLFTEVASLLPEPLPPPLQGSPGPFAFSDSRHVRTVLEQSGWGDIAVEPYDYAAVVGAGENPVKEALDYFSVIGPAARQVKSLSIVDRQGYYDRLRHKLERHCHGNLVTLNAAAWIISARKVGSRA